MSLNNTRSYIWTGGLVLSDGLSFILTSFLIGFLVTQSNGLEFVFGALPFVALTVFALKGHYQIKTLWLRQIADIFVTLGIAALLGFIYFDIVGGLKKGLIFVLYCLIAFVLVVSLRFLAATLLKKFGLKKFSFFKNVYLFGYNRDVIDAAFVLGTQNFLPIAFNGVIIPDENAAFQQEFLAIHDDIPVLKTFDTLPSDAVVIVCGSYMAQHFADIPETITLKALEDMRLSPRTSSFLIAGTPVLKLLMDKLVAVLLLMLTSPVFLVLAAQVKKDGGPAFYGQSRVGYQGQAFKCWKFRSMVTNSAEVLEELLENDPEARAEWEKDFKLKNDPRITDIGKTLRKTSLDELPQLWNVLNGEMSLVGPRPVTQKEIDMYYGDDAGAYQSAKPGMTGLWQVSGRNDVSYDRRVFLDRWYTENWSLWLDIMILLFTVQVVACKRGAY